MGLAMPLAKCFAACVLGCLLAAFPGVRSSALELVGAWVMEGSECDQMFVKKDSGLALVEDSELFGGGFVIEGDRLTSALANCQIKGRRQSGDELHVTALCTTRTITSSLHFALKVIDQNTILRFSPSIPGIETKYTRCAR